MKRRHFLQSSTGAFTVASTLGFSILSNQLMANTFKTDLSGKTICDSELNVRCGSGQGAVQRKNKFKDLRASGTMSCDDAVDLIGGEFEWEDSHGDTQTMPAMSAADKNALKSKCCN